MLSATPLKLGLIGEGTLDLLAPALIAIGARYGLLIECITGGYGQMVQDALSPDSAINRAGCDAVLLVLDHRTLMLDALPGDAVEATQIVDQAMELVRRVRQGLADHGGAHVIVPTLAAPVESLFGSLDRLTPGTHRATWPTASTARWRPSHATAVSPCWTSARSPRR